MKTIGIAIDDWKLPIFEKNIREAGYEFETHHISRDTLMLRIKAETISEIQIVVQKSVAECGK